MPRRKSKRSFQRGASSITMGVVGCISLMTFCTALCGAKTLKQTPTRMTQDRTAAQNDTLNPTISSLRMRAQKIPLSIEYLDRGKDTQGPFFPLREGTGRSNAEPITIAQRDAPVPEAKKTPTTKDEGKDATAQPPKTIENSIGMKLVLIPAGKFVMGSPENEKGRKAGEFQRPVTIKKPFYLGVYEVTQEQYERVMSENRSVDRGPNLPAGNVSITKAIEFCRRLNGMEESTYRLPTEAEWEYACRAGTTTPFHCGNSFTFENANFDAGLPYGSDKSAPALKEAQPVGSYSPNEFGLYDMHGNVWEWCSDRLRHRIDLHILRGGGGEISGQYCRSASRWSHSVGWQWTGLRVVRTVEPDAGEPKYPVTHAIDQADRFDTQTLIAKIDEAFAKPPKTLLPGVVVFPAVDGDRRVREDGVGIGWIANYAAAYTPQRRMKICLPNVRNNLYYAGCMKPGTVLDDESIKICLAACDAERYIVPQLLDENGKLKLTFTVRSLGETGEPPVSTYALEKDQLQTIPGLIARGILEQLNAELDENELKHISNPQVRSAKDLLQLSKITQSRDFGKDNRELLRFVMRNPRCTAGWELYVFDSAPAEKALERFSNTRRRLACDRLLLCAAVRQRASHAGLMKVLELAPQFPNDPYYFTALFTVSMNLSEPELVQHVLNVWRDMDSSYVGYSERGRLLVAWAWKSRGGGWASTVTQEGWKLFRERLQQAKQELEKAIDVNPLGWEAHSRLITVGMALDLPPEFVNEHFDRAIELRPRYRDAYARMFQTLQPRWGGDRDELLDFARICVQTDYWDEGIPEIGRRAIQELGFYPHSKAYKRTVYSDLDIWDAVLLYVENAQANARPEFKRFSLNLFAKYGVYGGHFEEVVEAFHELEKQETDPRVFWDGFTYSFLRDLVYSKTESGQIHAVASMRAALDVGDFAQAEEQLGKVVADSDETTKLLDRSRRAIEVGRELLLGQTVELSADQMFELFDGIDSHWKVEGDTLICRLPANGKTMILLPFGFSRAEVTGTLSWAESPESVRIHSHTRALRDNVSIVYEPVERRVGLHRGGHRVHGERLQDDEANFRMTLDGEEDEFVPSEHLKWEARVVEDVPSGIGFQATATENHHAVIMLKNVRIKPLE